MHRGSCLRCVNHCVVRSYGIHCCGMNRVNLNHVNRDVGLRLLHARRANVAHRCLGLYWHWYVVRNFRWYVVLMCVRHLCRWLLVLGDHCECYEMAMMFRQRAFHQG